MHKPPNDAGLRLPALDELQPEDRAEASEARRYIRANFDAMTAARDRGVSWHQITDTMAAAGVGGANAEPLGWRQLKSLYHTERYARGGKRKRRKVQPKAKAATPVSPTRPEVPEPSTVAPMRPEVGGSLGPPQPQAAAEADKLRAALARKRKDIGEPTTLTFGAEDRRRTQESDENG
jgi:hypothetical protein